MAVHEIQAFTNYESKDTSINSRRSNLRERWQLAELGEANVRGVLPEALTAHVEPVLPDQTSLVRAHPALTGSLSVVLRVGVPNSVVTHLDCLISILPQGSLDSTTVCMPGRERVRGGSHVRGGTRKPTQPKRKRLQDLPTAERIPAEPTALSRSTNTRIHRSIERDLIRKERARRCPGRAGPNGSRIGCNAATRISAWFRRPAERVSGDRHVDNERTLQSRRNVCFGACVLYKSEGARPRRETSNRPAHPTDALLRATFFTFTINSLDIIMIASQTMTRPALVAGQGHVRSISCNSNKATLFVRPARLTTVVRAGDDGM